MSQQQYTVGPAGVVLLAIALLVAVTLFGWRTWFMPEQRGTLERIQATGVVRIGYANEAPYGYLESTTGRITGEAPEIAKVVLKRLGAKEIQPVVTEFGSLIPGLKAGRFDVIAAGMYITPERAKEISFSNPTYAVGESFLVAAGNPRELHSFEDVAADPAARIGVMGGSVEHGYAKQAGTPSDRIVIFPDYPSALEGLKTDRVDAVAATILTANDLLQKTNDESMELADPFHDPVVEGKSVKGYGAFGFRPQDDALREAFNRELASFLGTRAHLELVRPFGFTKETLPPAVTAAELTQNP